MSIQKYINYENSLERINIFDIPNYFHIILHNYYLIYISMAIFIVTFRETLEAAIIIGLIFSMLNVFGVEKKRKRYITIGIVLGIIMSFFFAG